LIFNFFFLFNNNLLYFNLFVSAKRPKDVKVLLYAIKKTFKKHGKREVFERGKFDPKPQYREAVAKVVVGVLGYPNVGKSSIINALAHKKKTKVSKKSGTTHGIHWINATPEIKLIDSPGVIPLEKSPGNKKFPVSQNSGKFVDDEVRYGLIGAKDSEALKNPELVAHAIIKLFSSSGRAKFEKFYDIEMDEDVWEVVQALGLKRGHLVKGGKVDEHRTCSMIVRDWQQGRLRL